ncbi:MAG: ABC transporter ATP-binding protein [Alphaproteobacteria bacterium]|nr:ABC transporter ATP-binding protein [Alphaproteobacteria bacterium]
MTKAIPTKAKTKTPAKAKAKAPAKAKPKQGDILLQMRNIHIKGKSDESWIDIINGIDLDLYRGEVLGLIGESGAGKSTLGLAAMGFCRDGCKITDGSISFDGMDLMQMDKSSLRELRGKRIAYVAQSAAASFNPAHKLLDQFCEAPLVHDVMSRNDASQYAIDLYDRMNLPSPETFGLRYPHEVSGGQLQRAMTAMALSCRPDLIIFDEPTTALDVTTQIEVLAAIKDIVKEFNTAAIYISHDLAVVAQMADRIKVLLKGDEVEQAPTEIMLKKPSQEYTKSLWAVREHTRKEQPAVKNQTPVISIKSVTAGYHSSVDVLRDVSFDIHKRRTVAVVGESGSGKSTTARVVTGLLPPRMGSIEFQGETLPAQYQSRSREQLRHIQMIYQMADTALNPKLRIRDLIARPAKMYLGLTGKALDDRVRDLLHMIEMEPDQFIDRLPSELSGGQKQRIGIARAIAAEPTVIICDEVTSALDQLVAEGILKLLDRLQSELDLSYMFITHDLATVRAIADEVVVMKDGDVVEQGIKSKMFKPPHHPYTELLLGSVPEMDSKWLDRLLDSRGKDNLGDAAIAKMNKKS